MMKQKITALLAVAFAIGLTSCGDKDSTANATTAPADNYPLDVCVVSGESLGSMGAPHVINHEGTTVKLCCDSCLPQFNKDPEKFIAKLDPAE